MWGAWRNPYPGLCADWRHFRYSVYVPTRTTKTIMHRASSHTLTVLALSTACFVASCGGGGSSVSTFIAKATSQAGDPSFTPVVAGDFAAFRAIEADTGAAGTDLDGDGTPDDLVTMGLSLINGVTTSTNLNADEVFILDGEFFLIVDEVTNGVDYSGLNGAVDLVVMHWNTVDGTDPVYVADVERSAAIHGALTTERFYFVTPSAQGIGSTNICFADTTLPETAICVGGPGGGLDSCRILGDRENLILLTIDENVDGDLDGDLDGVDSFVLALLDGSDIAGNVTPTSVALRSDSTAFDAEALDVAGDGIADEGWLVAVLVDEIAEGADLNDPGLFTGPWLPLQCVNLADGDMTDEVLHYIYFGHPTFGMGAVNTGLVGRAKVLVVGGGHVATISPEDEANCNLNSDPDSGDLIPRWCAAVDPALGLAGILPPGAGSLMDAVALSPAGGSLGLVELEGNLVALISEINDSQDHDGDTIFTQNLIGYIDNLDADFTWDYDLLDPEGGSSKVGATWLGAESEVNRIAIGFQESVVDLNLNSGCNGVLKDADKTDSVAAWLNFGTNGLGVPGIGFAVDTYNMGGTFAGGNIFFRLSEAGDDRDYNNNGTKTDFILTRNPLGSAGCAPLAIGTLHSLVGPALFSDNIRGGVFYTDEADAKSDVNKDGDQTDFVLRWMRFL